MENLFKSIERVLAILAGIALFIMMILTFVVLMVVVIFAGVAFVTTSDQHIKVDIFAPWISRVAPGLHRWVVHIFSLVIYAGLTYELGRHMFDSLFSGKRTAVLDFPQWVMPGAAFLFSLTGVLLFGAAILATRGRLEKFDHATTDDQPGPGQFHPPVQHFRRPVSRRLCLYRLSQGRAGAGDDPCLRGVFRRVGVIARHRRDDDQGGDAAYAPIWLCR